MDLDPIDSHVLVFSILGIQQTWWRTGSGLDVEQSSSNFEQPEGVADEEGGDGDEETDEDRDDPEPLNHLPHSESQDLTWHSVFCTVCSVHVHYDCYL